MTTAPAWLVRDAIAAGVPPEEARRLDCRALSLAMAARPKAGAPERPASLDEIAAELERMSRQ